VSSATGIGLYSYCPGWNGDLCWVSAGNQRGFELFDRYFDQLQVAHRTKSVIRDSGELIMYSGFFVIRSHTSAPYYHYDYSDGVGVKALTMMTPVTAAREFGNLLYQDIDGHERIYKYRTGNAIAFGSHFYHSTQPFSSETPSIFLCFTYGVRDRNYWQLISETVAEQGIMYRDPELGIVQSQLG
jgi:hypothetical protein